MTDNKLERIRPLFESNTKPVLRVSEIAEKLKITNSTATNFIKSYGLKRSQAWYDQTEQRHNAGRKKASKTRKINIANKQKRQAKFDLENKPAYEPFKEPDEPWPDDTNFAAPGRHYHSLDVPDSKWCGIKC